MSALDDPRLLCREGRACDRGQRCPFFWGDAAVPSKGTPLSPFSGNPFMLTSGRLAEWSGRARDGGCGRVRWWSKTRISCGRC